MSGSRTRPPAVVPDPGRHSAPWVLYVVVFLVALALRLGPLLVQHTLGGVLEYDDGVHFSSAVELVAGHLPYRSFVFVQPPGITVLLAPFAGLAHLTGDVAALVTSRLVFMVIAAGNAVLVSHLVRQRGRVAMWAAGLLYATWGATVAAEHTLLLEPLLTFALLVAMTQWGRTDGNLTGLWAGVALGAGTAVKIWMGPVALVVLVLFWRRDALRSSVRFLAGYLGSLALICGPFLIAAPSAFLRDVIIDQTDRPNSGASLWDRLQYLSGLTNHPALDGHLTVHGLAVMVIAGLLVLVALTWRDPGARPWWVLAAVTMLLVLVAPSFSYHYVDFPAGPICVLVGVAAGRCDELAGRWREQDRSGAFFRRGLVVVGSLVLAGLAVAAFGATTGTAITAPALGSFARQQTCLWSSSTTAGSILLSLGVETAQVARMCPFTVDPYGEVLDLSRNEPDRSDDVVAVNGPETPAWQRIVRRQLLGSSAAVGPMGEVSHGWDRTTAALFHRLYRPVGSADGFAYFERR